MAKATSSRGRGVAAAPPEPRRMPVGRPLQAALVALEQRLGLFTEQRPFGADDRFAHPAIVPDADPVPPGMAQVFAAELGALERLGKSAERCHAVKLGPYRVCCRSHFHYDGFKALVYVERDSALVAAWMDEEVLRPDSPRVLLAGTDDAGIEAFLAAVSEH